MMSSSYFLRLTHPSRGGIDMMQTTRALFRCTLILLGIAASIYTVGCSTEKQLSPGPPAAVNSDEVLIVVFWDGSGLKAVPDRAHLRAGAQRAHWVAVNGDSLQISYKNPQAIGLNSQPGCGSVDCDMKVNPPKAGSTGYSISLNTAAGAQRTDPQLIVD